MTTSVAVPASDSRNFVPGVHLLQIRDWIYKTAGVFQPDHELAWLETRCMLRMKELQIGLMRDYLHYLTLQEGDPSESALLLDRIVDGETYFFRGQPQFDALHKIILPRILAAKSKFPGRTLKIWSAGCSSGEEGYSLAITLLEASSILKDWVCSIRATDLNEDSVARAKRGIYAESSTRNLTSTIRQKYFLKDGDSLSVCAQARALVEIQRLNLLDDRRMASMANFDVIFCRNVLIHFDMASRSRIVEHFHRSLSPDGFLFLGHAESLFGVTKNFSLVHMPSATAYEKNRTQPAKRLLP